VIGAIVLRIEFGASFSDIAEKELQISRKDVIRTVTNPLISQIILIDDLEVLLFLQKEKEADSYLLIIGQRKNNVLYVRSSCFKILPSLLEETMTNEPILLLQQLALNFGIPMRVGERIGKFFFRERVPVAKDFKGLSVIEILKPKELKEINVISSVFFKLSSEGFAEFAIGFNIELNAYSLWLKGQKAIHVSVKTYDIFISYKRKTAEDFVLHLKSVLVEQGFRAFLDLIDIPKEFEGTERWFDVRNSSIENSKRFLLIMTAGIDKSEEISKELTLARKTSRIKFLYLRHEDLKPEITIKTSEETINLAEGNQVSFSTKEDLARKVLGILSKIQKED